MLVYETVPQRVAVVRNGDLVELVIPSGPSWRVWVARQTLAMFAFGLAMIGFYLPSYLTGGMPLMHLRWAVVVYALAFAGAMFHRLRQGAPITVLQWDGQTLRAPTFLVAAGKNYTAGDPMKWSQGALGDLQVVPLWPGRLTGCGTVKVVSRFDYPAHLGVYPLAPLREALAEFRSIVLPDAERDDPAK